MERAGGALPLPRMNICGAVLVVEDDADVQRSARIALSSYVERVELLGSTDKLDDALAQSPFDVVLLDMNFVVGERSGAAGLNALTRVQAFDPTLAVVLMTACKFQVVTSLKTSYPESLAIIENRGMYKEITIPPTATPRNAIMIGSRRVSMFFVAASTSSS